MDTLQKMGHITFEFVGNPELMDVHIFRADDFHGEPRESEGRSLVEGKDGCTFPSETGLLLKHRTVCAKISLRREAAGL